MVSIEMIAQKAAEASVKINIQKAENIALENKFSFGMQVSEKNDRARATLNLTISDVSKEKLVIHCTTTALFSVSGIETDTDLKVLNTKCFEAIFPHAEKHMTTLAMMAGINDLPVPKPEFSFEDIQVSKPEDLC